MHAKFWLIGATAQSYWPVTWNARQLEGEMFSAQLLWIIAAGVLEPLHPFGISTTSVSLAASRLHIFNHTAG